jgi:hypothetical protein
MKYRTTFLKLSIKIKDDCPASGTTARHDCPARLPDTTARHDCPARLPGTTARHDCPARLPGTTARHDCPARLPSTTARPNSYPAECRLAECLAGQTPAWPNARPNARLTARRLPARPTACPADCFQITRKNRCILKREAQLGRHTSFILADYVKIST